MITSPRSLLLYMPHPFPRVRTLLITTLISLAFGHHAAAADVAADSVRANLAERAKSLEGQHAVAARGQNGWWFLTQELAHYGHAPGYWNDGADPSPLQVITAFRDNLAQAGVELVLVPVPGKVTLYPEMLDPPLAAEASAMLAMEDGAFYAELHTRGVKVINLLPLFARLKAAGTSPFCKTDSHFSPAGQGVAVKAVAEALKDGAWYASLAKLEVTTQQATFNATGDLVRTDNDEGLETEKLTVRQVSLAGVYADAPEASAARRASPVVLIGDSHCLVYGGAPELLADHASFGSQLSAETGLPIDVAANLGSGVNAPRMELARRKDNLAGKRCVVWVFTARAFTQGVERWKRIPVVR